MTLDDRIWQSMRETYPAGFTKSDLRFRCRELMGMTVVSMTCGDVSDLDALTSRLDRRWRRQGHIKAKTSKSRTLVWTDPPPMPLFI